MPGVEKVGPKTAVEVDRRIRLARRRDRRGAARSRASSARTCGKALDWLPQGAAAGDRRDRLRPLRPRARLARVRRARAARRSTSTRCSRSTSATASQSMRKELETALGAAAAQPRRQRRGAGAAVRRARRRAVAGDRKHYETVMTLGRARRLAAAHRRRARWPRSTPRPIRSTACARDMIGLSLSVAPRRGGLHPAGATTTPARPTSCRARGAGAAASRGWRTRPRPRSARTSSTTATCSPTTASRCRATRHDTMLQSYVLRGAQAARPGEPGRAPPRPQRR